MRDNGGITMKLLMTLAVFALFALSTTALAEADAKAGKTAYDSKCKTCHGADGKGNPAIAKMFKVTLRDLGSEEVQNKSDEELISITTKGTGKMKPVKGLSDEQTQDMVAFLRSLAQS